MDRSLRLLFFRIEWHEVHFTIGRDSRFIRLVRRMHRVVVVEYLSAALGVGDRLVLALVQLGEHYSSGEGETDEGQDQKPLAHGEHLKGITGYHYPKTLPRVNRSIRRRGRPKD